MPLAFAIDPDAIPHQHPDLSYTISVHKAIIRDWRRYGSLVHPGGNLTESVLMESIETLPLALRQLWKQALRHNKRRPSERPWDGSINDPSCEILVGDVEVLLLETTRATLVADLSDDSLSGFPEKLKGIEVCRFHGFSETQSLTTSRQKTSQSLLVGSNCAAEWKHRFGSWVAACDNATLVDRYGLVDYSRVFADAKKPGIWRALESFAQRRADRQVNVDLFLGDEAVSAAQIGAFESRAYDNLRNRGIRRLRLTVAPDSAFRDWCHHRYMRCDYAVFGFDKGFRVFSGDIVREDAVFWQNDRAEDPVFDRSEAALTRESLQRDYIF